MPNFCRLEIPECRDEEKTLASFFNSRDSRAASTTQSCIGELPWMSYVKIWAIFKKDLGDNKIAESSPWLHHGTLRSFTYLHSSSLEYFIYTWRATPSNSIPLGESNACKNAPNGCDLSPPRAKYVWGPVFSGSLYGFLLANEYNFVSLLPPNQSK